MLILAGTAALGAPGDPGTPAQFIRAHRCAVAARLHAIHGRGPIEVSRDRFIVVAPRGQSQRPVQCIVQDRDTRMLCEAASTAYGPPDGSHLRLDAPARATCSVSRSRTAARPGPERTGRAVTSLGGVDVELAALGQELLRLRPHAGFGLGLRHRGRRAHDLAGLLHRQHLGAQVLRDLH